MSEAFPYDVVVVGAGMVGSALACALADSPLRVALVEARPLAAQWPDQDYSVSGFDARVSALTPASQQWLDTLGVWQDIIGQRVCAYRHMHVWDAEGTASIDFDADAVRVPALGHIVENRVTATALLRRLQQQGRVECLARESVAGLEVVSGGHILRLQSGRTLRSRLVVAADGARSALREMLAMPMREWDYGHHAIVTTVATEFPHQHTAWQRFLPEGPLAFLPLPDRGEGHFCSIVWSALPDYAEQLMALDDSAFAEQLGQAFEHRLGAIHGVGQRFSFPLRQRHARDYVRPGFALVGDAAHTIHPLAGQGVNLGLADARVLAEELMRATEQGLSPGHETVLARYQRRRKGDNLAMMAAMEGFKRLFEQDALPLRWLRNSGMRRLNKLPAIKHRIMRSAMGL